MIFCARATRGRGLPSHGLMARLGVPVGGRVRKLRAPWEPAWRSSRRGEKSGGRYGWKTFPIPLLLSILQMETQETQIRAIAESVKVSTSFVHKTCKNLGPQTLKIPACKN